MNASAEREVVSSTCPELPRLPAGSSEAPSSPSKDPRAMAGSILITKTSSRGLNAPGGEDRDDPHAQGGRCNNSPACKRVILADYEKEATFRPKLNSHSLKILAKSSRTNASISSRIFEANRGHHEESPRSAAATKPSAHALRSAQDNRGPSTTTRLAEIQCKSGDPRSCNYTFRPQVSEKSMRIAEGLGTSFLDRQQMHMERKQRMLDEVHRAPVTKPKRLLSLRTPASVQEGFGEDASPGQCRQLTTNLPTIVHSKSSPTHSAAIPNDAHSEGGNKGLLGSPKPQQDGSWQSPRRPSSVPNVPPRDQPGDQETGTRGTECSTPPPKGKPLRTEKALPDDGDVKRRARVRAEKVVKSKKVFLVKSGYRALRRTLRERGWVEQNYKVVEEKPAVTPPKKTSHGTKERGKNQENDDDDGDGDGDEGDDVDEPLAESSDEEWSDEEEYCMVSQHLHMAYPNFIWTLKREPAIYNHLRKDQIVNHFGRAYSITTKVGLTTNLQNARWFGDTDPDSFYPRCYVLGGEEDKDAFVDDYRFTAAMSLLKLLVIRGANSSSNPSEQEHTPSPPPPPPLLPPPSSSSTQKSPRTPAKRVLNGGVGGEVPAKSPAKSSKPAEGPGNDGPIGEPPLQLAIKVCQAYLDSMEHKDIDSSHHHHPLTGEEWDVIIRNFYTASFNNGQFSCGPQTVQQAKAVLDQLEVQVTQYCIDGYHNIWIMKPGAMSRGRGISCKVRLEDVLEVLAASRVHRDGKWVIQKYIERPMLIYDTKFDIRQWFLVTDWNPLTMWMYKECYLRFSGQPYSLDDLNLSIHLCNNSIQKYYDISPSRAKELPKENMWDSITFQNYLNDRGEGDMWMSRVYPGMTQAIIHALLVTQDEVEHRKNTFELFGADFMLTEDFKPWLMINQQIEINCSPTMESSTMVTARMCREVLEDTIKVVIDRRDDKKCSTGNFELAYKQAKIEPPNSISLQLYVQGSSIHP